jgi:hypothetical protein
MSDQILNKSKTKLRASQSKLANAMFSFAEDVRKTSKSATMVKSNKVKATSVMKLSLALAELAEICDKLQTIQSHDPYTTTSTDCWDINIKIISIESSIRQYEALDVQARINMTLLQNQMLTVTNYAKIEKSTLDLTNVTTQAKTLVSNYQEYIQNLNDSRKMEITAKANFANYRRGKCICAADQKIVGSTQISGLIKLFSDGEMALKTVQTAVKTGMSSAASKISAAITANISDQVNYVLLQLQAHYKRASTCSDLSTNLTAPTSCREILDVVGRAQFSAWHVIQNGHVVKRNFSMAEKYLSEL